MVELRTKIDELREAFADDLQPVVPESLPALPPRMFMDFSALAKEAEQLKGKEIPWLLSGKEEQEEETGSSAINNKNSIAKNESIDCNNNTRA